MRISFIVIVSALLSLPAAAEDLERAAELLSQMADSVEAVRDLDPAVSTTGKIDYYEWVPPADEASNERPTALQPEKTEQFEYADWDFGTRLRAITIDVDATGKVRLGSRHGQVVTPNFRLYTNTNEKGETAEGYIDLFTESERNCDFRTHFWPLSQEMRPLIPRVPRRNSAAGTWRIVRETDQIVDIEHLVKPDSTVMFLEFSLLKMDGYVLPIRYKQTMNDIARHETKWTWAKTDWGTVYPQSTTIWYRIIYPDKGLRFTESGYLVNTINRSADFSEEELSFAAMGLKTGSIVFDKRERPEQRFEFRPDANTFLGLVERAARTPPATPVRPLSLLRLAIAATLVTIAAVAAGYFTRARWARG